MSDNYLTEEMRNRLLACMRKSNVTSSDLCRTLNVNYCDFRATLYGKSPCFGKWQKKISETLNTDRKELFKEFYLPKKSEREIKVFIIKRIKQKDGKECGIKQGKADAITRCAWSEFVENISTRMTTMYI